MKNAIVNQLLTTKTYTGVSLLSLQLLHQCLDRNSCTYLN